MIKNVENLPIEKLFGKNNNSNELFYKIPPYQREYAWKKEQWENLFDDINSNDQGYFLGSIICINNNTDLDVVDGQQRLTTISILLNTILNFINKYNQDHEKEKILDFIENEDNVLIYGQLKKIIYTKPYPKLTLSLQNSNNEDYQYLLYTNQLLEDNIKKPTNFGNRRISKAYEYFKQRLNDEDEQGNKIFSIDDVFIFLKKVLSASLVKIEVNDSASAFILFESINNRGIPLTPMDLIKNSIIGEMEIKENISPEKTNEQWQVIIENIESYENQVRFLRHYYHAFQYSKKDTIKLEKYTKATKSNLIHIYSELIKRDVKNIFDELINKSNIYKNFIDPTDKYKEKFDDLQRLGVAPAYSLLLYLFSEHKDYDYTKTLDFIENWFIRRHLTDFPATNKLDQIFLDLIQILSENQNDIFETIKIFLTDEKRFKDNQEFEKILANSKLYDINTGATRCLLTKLEKSKRTKENKVDFWEMRGDKKPTLVWSIEHILPQKPSEKSDWDKYFTNEDKEKYLHMLGNLTLTCYNSTLSNKSYKDKIKHIENSNDIGLKSGNVKLNDYLINKQEDIWTKEDIQKRGSILSKEVIELFNENI